MPPQTPYTPFRVFFSEKQGLSPDLDSNSAFTYIRFLEETDDPLARLYTQALRFVERDLNRIMDIAETVSVKSLMPHWEKQKYSFQVPESTKHLNSNRFEILANVTWEEFGNAIMDELGSTVFSSGRPDEFKKVSFRLSFQQKGLLVTWQNFEISRAFMRSLESLAPSLHSFEAMQSHPAFKAFEQRWQLPVYFQMRWKEIIRELEHHLTISRVPSSFREGEHLVL